MNSLLRDPYYQKHLRIKCKQQWLKVSNPKKKKGTQKK